jgi:hypothetical protein
LGDTGAASSDGVAFLSEKGAASSDGVAFSSEKGAASSDGVAFFSDDLDADPFLNACRRLLYAAAPWGMPTSPPFAPS